MNTSPPTDHDLDAYPHVFFTSDETRDPNYLDDEYNIQDMEDNATALFPSCGWKELNKYVKEYQT